MRTLKALFICLGLALLVGCLGFTKVVDLSPLYGPSEVKNRVLTSEQYKLSLAEGKVSYVKDVQPILDQRCVACHGCYDAPCQLKMESAVGLDRGASKEQVYGIRLKPVPPTRLGVDASTPAEWRTKGFYPVLNERRESPDVNLDDSVLAQMLLLKQKNPLPTSGPLGKDFDFNLERELSCPKMEEFASYADKHPMWGMPYGFPGLKKNETDTLLTWLKQGAHYPEPPALPKKTLESVARVEKFLNGTSNKQRLVSRYIYEHLFMGHMHFRKHADREFFRLVRSKTPPGQPVEEIATVRPYGDPGTSAVYYRLKPFQQTIVDKNHTVYELDEARLKRWQNLFLDPVYEVRQLPDYEPLTAANPFVAFAAIPPKSRYRFMLDDAGFFIEGFMKGPVCRGQVALNVIRDRFWVFFYDPDQDPLGENAGFLDQNANNLRLPSVQESEIGVLELSFAYSKLEKSYLDAKNAFLVSQPGNVRNSLAAVWNGNGTNPSAALTVFRHFDSASLSYGFIGKPPLTSWALDYPLFERIHYLLVAGYDVFGSVTHEAATRLYMDQLRNEAENNFLSFLPARNRPAIYDFWYRGFFADIQSAIENPYYGYGKDTAITFKTSQPKEEFLNMVRDRLGAMAGPVDLLNNCTSGSCDRPRATALQKQAEQSLRTLADLHGVGIQHLPDLAYLRVNSEGGKNTAIYSIINNQAMKNVAFMFREKSRRVPEEDTMTLVPDFVGSYPNFFYDVEMGQLPDFVKSMQLVNSREDMAALAQKFGVLRTNPEFWSYSDFFNEHYRKLNPVKSGIFDLNRYDNP